jgi:lipopolysaccharide biosynthesis glycosyltransferase
LYDSDPVVLVLGADDAFAKPLAVTLYSALVNYHDARSAKIYIVDGGIRPSNRARINRILKRHGRVAEWLSPNLDLVRDLNTNEQYPTSVYLRLLIPSLLPDTLEKVIYLDSDVIVEENIAALWDIDIGDHALLAVQDEGVWTVGSPKGLANYRELGLNATDAYFNSGVLVFNLRTWRERQLADQVIRYVAAHPETIRFGEQDAMNAVLTHDWSPLSSKWNQHVAPWKGNNDRVYHPGILHFVTNCKPWNADGVHCTNVIYDRYMKACGWYGLLTWWLYYLPLVVQRQHVLFTRAAEQITANAIDTQELPLRNSPDANRSSEASEPTAHEGHHMK